MNNDEIYNWNEIWKRQLDCNGKSRVTGDCATMWATKERALEYLTMSRADEERIEKELQSLPLSRDARVLDIGAGPGTLAVPLARRVAHVTAVEPAQGMVEVLADRLIDEQVENVSCVQKRWEDVDIDSDLDGPYDIVIASFSLGMPDIRAAIEAMCSVSTGWIYLYWFAGLNSWEHEMLSLWPTLHGHPYCPGPKVDVLYNVLYSMGIYPNMDVTKMERTTSFPTLDDAVVEYSRRFNADTPEKQRVVKEHLSSMLTPDGESLQFRGMHTRVKLWWRVVDSAQRYL